MSRNPGRLRWAAALAALIAAVGGPFFSYWPSVVGLASSGQTPLLAGSAATAVALLLAPVVGAVTAGVSTYLIGKNGHEVVAAALGVLASLVAVGAVQEASAPLAQDWVTTFGSDPAWAALYGGVVAGGLTGVAFAFLLAAGSAPAPVASRARTFAATVGSLGGFVAGLGGGLMGNAFAVMASACPNGYYSNPSLPAGQCPVGIGFTSFLYGSWAGAVAGAILCWLVFSLLRRGADGRAATTHGPRAAEEST